MAKSVWKPLVTVNFQILDFFFLTHADLKLLIFVLRCEVQNTRAPRRENVLVIRCYAPDHDRVTHFVDQGESVRKPDYLGLGVG